jgi:hypothetical protein
MIHGMWELKVLVVQVPCCKMFSITPYVPNYLSVSIKVFVPKLGDLFFD